MVRTRLAAAVLVLLTCAGCGFLEDLATPEPPPAPAVPPPADSTWVAPTPAPEPLEVLEASIADDRDFPFTGGIRVIAGPEGTGLPPLPRGFATGCGFPDDATTQYLPVTLTFANTSQAVAVLAAGVELRGADDVGLFTDSGAPGTAYCQDGDRAPSADHFAVGPGADGVGTVRMFLVRTGAAPGGFGGLELAFTDLENTADSVPGPWEVGRWTTTRPPSTGAPCPDDGTALCATLG